LKPDDFDANNVADILINAPAIKGFAFSDCVFCKRSFGGHNATEMQVYQCGRHSISCLGCSSGEMPVWFRDALSAAVVSKAVDKQRKAEVYVRYL